MRSGRFHERNEDQRKASACSDIVEDTEIIYEEQGVRGLLPRRDSVGCTWVQMQRRTAPYGQTQSDFPDIRGHHSQTGSEYAGGGSYHRAPPTSSCMNFE